MCVGQQKLLSLWILATVSLVTCAADICVLVIYGSYIQHQLGKNSAQAYDVKTWIIYEIWSNIFRAKLGAGMLMMVCAGLLVYGVRKEKKLLMLPWIGCSLVLTFLNALSMKNCIHRYGLVTINIYRLLIVVLLGFINMVFVWQVMGFIKKMEQLAMQRRLAEHQEAFDAVEMADGSVLCESAPMILPVLQPIYQNGSNHFTQPGSGYTPPPEYNTVIHQQSTDISASLHPPSYEEVIRQDQNS